MRGFNSMGLAAIYALYSILNEMDLLLGNKLASGNCLW